MQRDGEGVPEESVLPLSGQGWQEDSEVAPRAVEYVFRGQLRQGSPAVSWDGPAAQGTQLELRRDPEVRDVFPRGHSKQEEEPDEGA